MSENVPASPEPACIPPAGYQLRGLTGDDAAGGLRLSRQAGWNQTAADWTMILRLGFSTGLFRDDKLIATTVSLHWGSLAWIAMVLVDEDYRRQGLGSFLLRLHIDEADKHGKVAALDASEQGLPLYEKQGFKEVCRLTRYVRDGETPSTPAPTDPISPEELTTLDGRHSLLGDRSRLFQEFSRRKLPMITLPMHAGFACLRLGDFATQIGPLIALDPVAASRLADQAVQLSGGAALLVDVPDYQDGFRRSLEAVGFSSRRSFVRMLRADDPCAIHPSNNTFAVAGPELG